MNKHIQYVSQRGVVLLLVLWLMVVLTIIAVALAGSMQTYLGQNRFRKQQARERQAEPSAIAIATQTLRSHTSVAPMGYTLNNGEIILFSARHDQTWLGLSDEAARLNANTASAKMLSKLPGMTLAIANEFVRLRDQLSASNDATATLGHSMPMENQTQLVIILKQAIFRGMTLATGENTRQSWRSPETRSLDISKLLDDMTIHTRVENIDDNESPRVNLNTANAFTINEIFDGQLTLEQIAGILQSRKTKPFTNIGELLVRDFSHGNSDRIRITPALFATAADKLTTRDDRLLFGLVNINTAPADVLACLPGLDSQAADRLITHRATLDSEAKSTIAWPLEVLSVEQFEQICDNITVRSNQFRTYWAYLPKAGNRALYGMAVFERKGSDVSIVTRRAWLSARVDPRQFAAKAYDVPPLTQP